MPKLNKLFLAIIVALLFTALVEVVFIFVYKPMQTIPLSTTTRTPTAIPYGISGKTAVSSGFLSAIQAWPSFVNQKTTLTNEISGTIISTNIPQTEVLPGGYQDPNPKVDNSSMKFIYLNWPNKNYIRAVGFTKTEWDNIKVFDVRNGVQTAISLSDLTPGDNITIQEVFNANTSNGLYPDTIIIFRIK